MLKMVMKKFVIVIGSLLILSLAIFGGYYFSDDDFVAKISGNTIKEKLVGIYESSSVSNKVLILIQFVVGIIAAVIIFIVINKRLKKKATFSRNDFVENKTKKSRTDLDMLYEILKKRKKIDIVDIESVFKVSPKVAFGWAKILENGDLAVIEYPRFGKPILILMEEENTEDIENEGKEAQEKIPETKTKKQKEKKGKTKIMNKLISNKPSQSIKGQIATIKKEVERGKVTKKDKKINKKTKKTKKR
jgi:hypothetical protein